MGDDRSTVDSILDGLEILDEDGPRLIERAFGDEIPSCMDDFADPDDSMWRNGDGRDVLWDLLLDHPLLDPMHGIALDPYVADSEHPDVIIRLFDTSFVDDLSGRGAVARIPVDDGHMDALVAMCERIAHDGRWVASGTDPRETLRRCEEVVRRCQRIEREVNDWEANARKRGQREAMRQGGEKAVMAALSTYLDRALDEYRGKGGWKGLAAEAGIETFIRFATEDSPSTPLPEILAHAADGTRVETPVGTIRAVAEPGGIYIDLEKPDGTSGQVAFVEATPEGMADEYPTPLHVFTYDGNDDDVTSRTDVDVNGSEMSYPARKPSGADAMAIGNDPASVAEAARQAAQASLPAGEAPSGGLCPKP